MSITAIKVCHCDSGKGSGLGASGRPTERGPVVSDRVSAMVFLGHGRMRMGRGGRTSRDQATAGRFKTINLVQAEVYHMPKIVDRYPRFTPHYFVNLLSIYQGRDALVAGRFRRTSAESGSLAMASALSVSRRALFHVLVWELHTSFIINYILSRYVGLAT